MIVALLLVAVALAQPQCPTAIHDELQLLAQPLECFRQLYDYKKHDGHRLLRTVNDRLQTYRRMLQELRMSKQQHLQTTPVVKWAQSNGQIFISFKLSHRQDSPTCSDIRAQSFKTEEVNETVGDIVFESGGNGSVNASSFSYQGECFFTTQKFLFGLALSFEGKLKKLVFRKEGLGLYTIIGDKEEPAIWVQPFTDYKTAAIWSEMRGKHSGDMDRYFEMAEGLLEAGKTSRRRTRKRPKKVEQGEDL